jgi:hypothetical protein
VEALEDMVRLMVKGQKDSFDAGPKSSRFRREDFILSGYFWIISVIRERIWSLEGRGSLDRVQ